MGAAAIEKACGDKWPKDGPIIWLNMRQEAIVYVNGSPVCARPANKIGEYAELGNVTRASVKAEEVEFAAVLKKRAELKSRRWSHSMTSLRVSRQLSPVSFTIASL